MPIVIHVKLALVDKACKLKPRRYRSFDPRMTRILTGTLAKTQCTKNVMVELPADESLNLNVEDIEPVNNRQPFLILQTTSQAAPSYRPSTYHQSQKDFSPGHNLQCCASPSAEHSLELIPDVLKPPRSR